MKAKKIIAVVIIVILTLILLAVAGQYAGGIFLLKRLGLDPHTVKLMSLYDYYQAYGKIGGDVGRYIKMSLAMSFAPVVILLGFVVAIIAARKTPIDKLYGDARFATDMELKQANMLIEEKNIFELSLDSPLQSKWPPLLLGKKGKNYVVDKSQEYTTLSAMPGAGKGVSFVIPNLLFYWHNVVNFDPKLENFRRTAGYREKVLGQEVFLFCPDNTDQARAEDGEIQAPKITPETTHCWNPLDYISDDPKRSLFDIKTITSIVIDAPEGQNQGFYLDARKALDGILLYLMETPEEERTMYNAGVINDAPMGFHKWAPMIISQRAKSSRPLSEQCVRLLMSYANENEKKRDTTRGIVNTCLDPFSDPYSRAATRKSDFSFHDLRKKKMSIYVGISPQNIPKFRKMLNLFFAQAISCNVGVLPDDGPKDKDGNPLLKYQVLFLLDEFVALGPIEIIRSSSGYTRAYNVRYAIVFQNKAQVFADQCYGRAGGESLLDTFANEIVFATESTEEAKDYSERLGYTTLKHRERSRTNAKGGNSTTDNIQRHQRALMLPQEIQRLPYEEELFFKKGGRVLPVRMKKIVWYTDPEFSKRADLPLPKVPPMIFDGFDTAA
ncbi:type IV secretory system conjugative DNA transfer family protein [Pseudomonas syringae pv. coryli]|uniref:type IV secretory system conjugative DNA transfer family protein n=1 Tax=Pseudomonas syringae pv. coryli TaxID=317659 RepID=UPI003D2B435A